MQLVYTVFKIIKYLVDPSEYYLNFHTEHSLLGFAI